MTRRFRFAAAVAVTLLLRSAVASPAYGQTSTRYATLAEAARAAGFCGTATSTHPDPCTRVSTCRIIGDRMGGSQSHGRWDPSGTTVLTRYGDDGRLFFGYCPNLYVGTHSRNPNREADIYAERVLNFQPLMVIAPGVVQGDEWWREDLNRVNGLSAFVMAQARARGMVPDDGPSVPAPVDCGKCPKPTCPPDRVCPDPPPCPPCRDCPAPVVCPECPPPVACPEPVTCPPLPPPPPVCAPPPPRCLETLTMAGERSVIGVGAGWRGRFAECRRYLVAVAACLASSGAGGGEAGQDAAHGAVQEPVSAVSAVPPG